MLEQLRACAAWYSAASRCADRLAHAPRPGWCARRSASAGSGSWPPRARRRRPAPARPGPGRSRGPTAVTNELSAMFWALNGATRTPRRAQQPAQAGDDVGLAGVAGGAAHHQPAAAGRPVGPSAMVTSPASMLGRPSGCPGSRIGARLRPSSPERPWPLPPAVAGTPRWGSLPGDSCGTAPDSHRCSLLVARRA